jgi:hypothetical protein
LEPILTTIILGVEKLRITGQIRGMEKHLKAEYELNATNGSGSKEAQVMYERICASVGKATGYRVDD